MVEFLTGLGAALGIVAAGSTVAGLVWRGFMRQAIAKEVVDAIRPLGQKLDALTTTTNALSTSITDEALETSIPHRLAILRGKVDSTQGTVRSMNRQDGPIRTRLRRIERAVSED